MSVPTQDGMHRFVDEADYHADRGSLSVSGAKLLLPPSCPAKFRWEQDNTRKPKKVWDFGHVAHKLVLGKGAEFEILDPAVHGLKADGTPSEKPTATAMWRKAEAEARARGKVPIHVDLFTKAYDMAERVRQHPTAGPIFADAEGQAEVALYHTDPETGVRLRGRIDWLTGDIDDYKTSTTANPAELHAKFYRLGYYMQAAWYIDLAVAVGASESPRFRFVVQEKEPPYVVTVVEYDEESIEQGRRANRQAIRLYADCLERGEWPGYSDSVVTISLPKYALQDGIQDEADALIAELEGIYK
ncbi:RecE-like exonuclease [Mycobacterium phage MichelleMyBell]|uniref:RecE-like exonuclease n=1 Tax=Mycobacterium phage MichelleMyBell TaxID=1445726 RepID=W0LNS9_9CAUD|nr:exonuclease VIII [Mycobacterium phage MichelleMyBell]AHG24368.1 RecE-like exonuclease [Mycobacterium phage MichelleMyBell]